MLDGVAADGACVAEVQLCPQPVGFVAERQLGFFQCRFGFFQVLFPLLGKRLALIDSVSFFLLLFFV